MFGMEPLKDNQPWRRALSVVLGVTFIIWGLVAIVQGHITAFRHHSHTFYATGEPSAFWLVVVIVIALGISCVYRGLRGRQ